VNGDLRQPHKFKTWEGAWTSLSALLDRTEPIPKRCGQVFGKGIQPIPLHRRPRCGTARLCEGKFHAEPNQAPTVLPLILEVQI